MLLNVLSKTKNSFDAIACAQIYNAKSMLTISIKKNEDRVNYIYSFLLPDINRERNNVGAEK